MTTTLDDLPTPALVLDLDVLEHNLATMAGRARALGVSLRPHVKTHKCVEIARRQAALGARGITVSTVHEARVFADHGFDDVTWAFPLVPSRLPDVLALARRIRLGVVVDTPEAVAALEAAGEPLRVWLKVDCGYHRAGVDPEGRAAVELARRIHAAGGLELAGILSHSGHAYGVEGRDALARVAEEERAVMAACARRLSEAGVPVPDVSVGSTPAMSAVRSLAGVTEARPGNYALYDRTQAVLGSCRLDAVAVTVLTTVVSRQPGAGHCIVDAGALALSKDTGPGAPHRRSMGEVLEAAGRLSEEHRVVSVSQEHGRVEGPLPTGTRVRIVPNHSCLTVSCFDEFHVARRGVVVDRWRIHRGR